MSWATSSALARATADRLGRAARAAGPPRDDELALVTVAHALVMRTGQVDATKGRALAAAIAAAASASQSSQEFVKRAKAAGGAARTIVEALPAFGADGKTAAGNTFDLDFVTGAFRLRSPGEISPVVETRFGWHVIRLESRALPPETPEEREARRATLTDAVVAMRARASVVDLLRAAHGRVAVEPSVGADDLMARATAGP